MPIVPKNTIDIWEGLIVTLTGGARLLSDYRDDLELCQNGAVRFQMQWLSTAIAVPESNSAHFLLFMSLNVFRKLDTAEAERDYTEADMQTFIESMIDPAFWTDNAPDVEAFRGEGTSEPNAGDVERIGNAIKFNVTMTARLLPN